MCTLRANLLKNPHRVEANQNHARSRNFPLIPLGSKTSECVSFSVGSWASSAWGTILQWFLSSAYPCGHVYQHWGSAERGLYMYYHQEKDRSKLYQYAPQKFHQVSQDSGISNSTTNVSVIDRHVQGVLQSPIIKN